MDGSSSCSSKLLVEDGFDKPGKTGATARAQLEGRSMLCDQSCQLCTACEQAGFRGWCRLLLCPTATHTWVSG